MKTLFIFLLFSVFLQAEDRIEFYSTFPVNTETLTEIVGYSIVPGDQNRFKKVKGFKKYLPTTRKKEKAKVVFWNISHKQHKYLKHAFSNDMLILFMWEPPTVLSDMYKKQLHKHFAKIYTWDDDLVDGKKYFKFYYPELKPMTHSIVPFEEKQLCTMVVGKHSSSHPNELYSLREQAIAFFDSKPKEVFAFYGHGWNPKLYQNYCGPVENKIDTLRNYRFSICFENIKGLNGYVTEKIFDCFAAGNIPVYLGAENITSYIPENCFIDMRKFDSFGDLYHFLSTMPKDIYEGYLERIKLFLNSEQAQIFSRSYFHEILSEVIAI